MSAPKSRDDTLANAGLAVIGAVLALSAAAWVAVNLTGLLTGRGWAGVTFADTPGALLALPSHAGDPAAAFAGDPAARIPGPVAFYLIAGGITFAVLALAVYIAVRVLIGRAANAPTPARYATRSELRPLAVPDEPDLPPSRLALGYAARQLVAAEPNHSVIVFGPPGSGKTLCVVERNVLGWRGPAIITSVKSDVLEHTRGHRARRGPVYVFDPTSSTGDPSALWTPLEECRTWAGAVQMAGWLTDSSSLSSGGAHESFWSSMGRDLMAPLLYAAANKGLTMSDVLRWVQRQDKELPPRYLREIGEDLAVDAWEGTWNLPPNTIGSVYATVKSSLSVYGDPQAAATAAGCDVWPDRFLDENATLYLVAPSHAQTRLRPLFEALIMSIVRAAQDRAHERRTLNPALLLMLDEAANVAPLRELPGIASTGRGEGIEVVSIWQDLAQVEMRYGGKVASSLVNNHRAKLALSGIADIPTLDYLSKLLGDAEVERLSYTRQAAGGASSTTSSQHQRLAPADQLRQMRLGQALLVYGAIPPAKLTLARADRGPGRGRYNLAPAAPTPAPAVDVFG